jgi:hypothetical protein
MKNHTGTHVLNYALRKVLESEADQVTMLFITLICSNKELYN